MSSLPPVGPASSALDALDDPLLVLPEPVVVHLDDDELGAEIELPPAPGSPSSAASSTSSSLSSQSGASGGGASSGVRPRAETHNGHMLVKQQSDMLPLKTRLTSRSGKPLRHVAPSGASAQRSGSDRVRESEPMSPPSPAMSEPGRAHSRSASVRGHHPPARSPVVLQSVPQRARTDSRLSQSGAIQQQQPMRVVEVETLLKINNRLTCFRDKDEVRSLLQPEGQSAEDQRIARQAFAEFERAWMHHRDQRPIPAVNHLLRYLLHCKKLKNRVAETFGWNSIALCYQLSGANMSRQVIHAHTSHAGIATSLRLHASAAVAQINLALWHMRIGAAPSAVRHHVTLARAHASKAEDDHTVQALVLLVASVDFRRSGQPEKAVEPLQRFCALYDQHSDAVRPENAALATKLLERSLGGGSVGEDSKT